MSAEGQIVALLSRAMENVQAIRKEGRYDGGRSGSYNFRGVDQVVNTVGPVFRELGVVVVPFALDIKLDSYPTRNGGEMHRAIVKMSYLFNAPDGSRLECVAFGEAADAGDKSVSKAQSVAFRVALLQALCVPTDEPDPDLEVHEAIVTPAEPKVSPEDAKAIEVAFSFLDDEKKARLDDWTKKRGIAMWRDLTVAQAETLKKSLNITEGASA